MADEAKKPKTMEERIEAAREKLQRLEAQKAEAGVREANPHLYKLVRVGRNLVKKDEGLQPLVNTIEAAWKKVTG